MAAYGGGDVAGAGGNVTQLDTGNINVTGSDLCLILSGCEDATQAKAQTLSWDPAGNDEAMTGSFTGSILAAGIYLNQSCEYLDNPTAANAPARLTLGAPGPSTTCTIAAAFFTAAGDIVSTDVATDSDATTSTSASSTAPNVVTGDMVVDFLCQTDQGALTAGADQTSRGNATSGSYLRMDMSTQAGADGGVMSWSAFSAAYGMTHFAVRIPDAGGAAASISGSGNIDNIIAVISGVGERIITGQSTLDSYLPVVSGTGTAFTVITGSGATDGFLPVIAGVGERIVTGSGNADSFIPTVTGVGERTVTGTGTPTALIPVVSGVGERTITGTGTPTALIPVVSGTGEIAGAITGSGDAAAQLPVIAGVAERIITGTGTPTVLIPVISGVAERTVTGSGDATVQLPVISGSGTVGAVSQGTGAIVAPTATVSGVAERIVTGTGASSALIPTVTGVAERIITSTGAVSAQLPVISGTGTVGNVSTGTGNVVSFPPTVSGAGLRNIVALAASIAVASVTVAGVGERIVTGSGAITAPTAQANSSQASFDQVFAAYIRTTMNNDPTGRSVNMTNFTHGAVNFGEVL